MKKYNSMTTIAISIDHDKIDGSDITLDDFMAALMRRAADIAESDKLEAFDDLIDTQEK